MAETMTTAGPPKVRHQYLFSIIIAAPSLQEILFAHPPELW